MTRAVLLVDDDEPIRTPLKAFLEAEGFRVLTARHGKEALEVLQAVERPGVILLDLMMPIMSGSELLEVLRNDGRLQRIPIVILSAWMHRWTARSATAENIHVLAKPIDTDRLLALVRGYCEEPGRPSLTP